MRVLNELITKEDAINAVNRYRTSIMDTKRAIYALPSTQQWIPVSEKLPDIGENVIVTYSDGEVDIITRARPKLWTREVDSNLILPIAWMPLPKPYRPESEDKE